MKQAATSVSPEGGARNDLEMKLSELFPDEDQKFHLRFSRGVPAEYFAPTSDHEAIVAERARWLRGSPGVYSALLPAGIPLLEETAQFAARWHGFDDPDARPPAPHAALLALG